MLPLVGIDLTALSVFGGALGVGLGFGLQKIASNYISGFIILLDRSVTIGDVVTIEKHTGKLSKMTARYVVVRALDGTEAIIPNETVITSAVINQSYTDRKVAIAMSVQISYAADLDLAMQHPGAKLRNGIRAYCPSRYPQCDQGVCRQRHRSGTRRLGLEDPEQGKTNFAPRSITDIWQEFKARGIVIPYPQREVQAGRRRDPPR